MKKNEIVEQLDVSMSHIVKKHIHVCDADLRKRIAKGMKIATKFDIPENEISNRIMEVIQEETGGIIACVMEWLADTADRGDFYVYKDLDCVIGHGYLHDRWHDWRKGSIECSAIFVVLRKCNAYIQVVTAFPYTSRRDIQMHLKKL